MALCFLLHRQNVVIVGAGRSSRSAKFVTSSELLYLLNLLYNTPSECCDEYKLIQLYQNSSVWCFAFSHTSTFELIPAVATAQPGALVTEVRPPVPNFTFIAALLIVYRSSFIISVQTNSVRQFTWKTNTLLRLVHVQTFQQQNFHPTFYTFVSLDSDEA